MAKDDAQNTGGFDLNAARKAIAKGRPIGFPNVELTACRINGRDMRFATDRQRDPVQRCHRQGKFYEDEELAVLKSVFPLGGTFVDIGANVGNHSLFIASFLSPARVIPFEPNPIAYKLLLANICLNGLQDMFDLSNLGIGLSDVDASGYAMEKRGRNLGAAKMLPDSGDIMVERGDTRLAKVTPDLIKIDVEGMEMQVLGGLEETVARARPWLFVEVDDSNADAFAAWAEAHAYTVEFTLRRYQINQNYLLKPKPGD